MEERGDKMDKKTFHVINIILIAVALIYNWFHFKAVDMMLYSTVIFILLCWIGTSVTKIILRIFGR